MNVKTLLEKQLAEAQSIREGAAREVLGLQEKIKTSSEKKGMEAWMGFQFESSSGLTEEFAAFNRDFRAHVKKHLPEGARLVEWNRGHFYCSGFVERGGKFVYFLVSDVRFFPDDWYNDILVRTAKSAKDYTGGSNRSTRLSYFTQVVDDLLNREG